MLESIEIKNVASYDNEVGQRIDGLKNVNFFFGNNGSGKSTIAKFIFNQSLDEENKEDRFDSCSLTGFNPLNEKFLVYDEKFVVRNFIRSSTQDGIFSLNERNDEIDSQIEKERIFIEEKEAYIVSILDKRDRQISEDQVNKKGELLDFCFNKREAFSTFYKYNLSYKGSKQRHFESIVNILKEQPIQMVTIEQLTEQYAYVFENELSKVDRFINPNDYKNLRLLETEINEHLDQVIVGSSDVDIAELIDNLGIKKWVEEGWQYINLNEEPQKCPFCQEYTIDKNLIKKFELYFDESYKQKIENLKKIQSRYESRTNSFIQEVESLRDAYDPGNILTILIDVLKEKFKTNNEIIKKKISMSNIKMELESILELKNEIVNVNRAIRINNRDYDNLDTVKNEFIRNSWLYFANQCKTEIESYFEREKKYHSISQQILDLRQRTSNEILESRAKIEEWRQQTINTNDAVDQINVILRNSGFNGFEISFEDNNENNISRYSLKRNSTSEDNVFQSLSEGEKNFVAFLYFYQLCLGTDSLDTGEKKKIIVIDDPVSSLDSQVLFIVSSLVQQLIARKGNENRANKRAILNPLISQVIILTHNIFFYKEVTVENNRSSMDKQFYLVSKMGEQTIIESRESKEVASDYTLMWSSLRKLKNEISDQDREHNVVVGNLMRRILESYVNFMGIGKSVWNSIKSVNPEDARNIICTSLISEINDLSHKVSPLDDIYFTRIMSFSPSSLFEVFKMIFDEIGKEHYELMMGEEN